MNFSKTQELPRNIQSHHVLVCLSICAITGVRLIKAFSKFAVLPCLVRLRVFSNCRALSYLCLPTNGFEDDLSALYIYTNHSITVMATGH